ncbi:MAG: metal ABC transporter ATP-binding protein [Oligoflexia bacterium]|nr:metal ABC transporter ATP-binding protein [Oligoflexia bacterium]
MILTVSGMQVRFSGVAVFPPLSFTLAEGRTLVVLGPNGAGKTLLLRALLELLPHEGTVTWKPATRVGYVPQRVPLQRDLPVSVGDFFGFKRTAPPGFSAREALSQVGIDDPAFLRRQIGVLSSGQFQRVLIAWALSGNPDALLFDEPTAGIDIEGERTIHELLAGIRRQRPISLILVTHDLSTVYAEADHVLCLNRRASCYGPPQEILDPATLGRIFGRETKYVRHDHF